jgi:pimeloyl-ACP methyl ester carboxylesterase
VGEDLLGRAAAMRRRAALAPDPRSDEHGARLYPGAATPWHELTYAAYQRALRTGALRPGIVLASPPVAGRPTAVCLHGWRGTPADFRPLAEEIRRSSNLAFFLYDDRRRLAGTAELLRRELRALGTPGLLIAFSMGTLICAYAGATDLAAELGGCVALYLNPLLGGARYADADPVLAWLDQVPGLYRLHALKRLALRVLFPASVRDLDPGSRFQQTIFGQRARRSTFHGRTTIIWTENGAASGMSVLPQRAPLLFSCSRDELLQRLGGGVVIPPGKALGHTAPVRQPGLVAPAIEAAIRTWL